MRRCGLALVLLAALGVVGAQAEPPRPVRHVLIVYSQDRWNPAHEVTDQGLHEALTSSTTYDTKLYAEYLDLARFSDPAHLRDLAAFLQRKYAGVKLDVIVAHYPSAIEFLFPGGEPLFPGVPVVACEVTRPFAERIDAGPLRRLIAGTIVADTVDGLLEHAFLVRPKTKHVALIAGTAPNDLYVGQVCRRGLERYRGRADVIDLTGLSYEDVLRRVHSLPPDTIVLLSTFFRDATGRSFITRDVLAPISTASDAPLFNLFYENLGLGMVGGRVESLTLHGREAATMALAIMQGTPPASIPWGGTDTYVNAYDWRELNRWGIPETAVPAGSEIRFHQQTFWEQYHAAVLGFCAVLFVQTALIVGLLVNIRARRFAERSLRESEQQVRLAVSGAGAGLWSREIGSERLWADQRMRELHDLREGIQPTHADVLSVMHPGDREVFTRALRHAIETGEPLVVEYRVVCPDGTIRWIASRGQRVTYAKGKSWRMMGIAIDVTERKTAEDRLRQSEARLASAVVIAALGFYDLRGSDSPPFMDDHLRRLLGIPHDHEVDGLAFWATNVHPDDREAVMEQRRRMLAGETSHFNGEYRYLHPRHGLMWLRHSAQVLERDAEGGLSRAVGVIQDVTERRASEELLRQSEEFSRTVLASLLDGVVIVDREGTILAANDLWSCFGMGSQGRPEPGTNYLELCADTLPDEVLEGVASVLGGTRERFESEYRHDTGTGSRWLLLRAMPLRRHGGGAVIAHSDVTERVKAAEELHRVRAELWHAERVSQAGLITSSLAHELNQPLAAILSNAQAGLRFMTKGDVDLEEIRAILVDIVQDDKRAAGVIAGLRGLLRRQEAVHEPVDVASAIHAMLTLLHSELIGENVEVRLQLEPDAVALANRGQVQQVVLNLVMNAIEALRATPRTARRVAIYAAQREGRDVLVTIHDTGPGIPDELHEKMAEAFWTTKRSGLGVGLHISRSIIESHGGRLWFENHPDGGALFSFTLPLSPVSVSKTP